MLGTYGFFGAGRSGFGCRVEVGEGFAERLRSYKIVNQNASATA